MGLDTVEFVLEIEEEFSITISDQDAEALGVVGDIARYVTKESARQNGVEVNFETALLKIIDMLSNNYGIPRQNINSVSHVVNDLGLN